MDIPLIALQKGAREQESKLTGFSSKRRLLMIIACSAHKPLIAVKTDNRKADKGG
jgi:hypothetical protein